MSSESIQVSVVIVNWNTRQYLLDVIESLRAATHRTTMEVIVVDNASEDGSAEALSATYPEVILIRNTENLGFAKANNQGFEVAQGRALCLVNTDITAHDGVVDRLWEHLEQNPDVGVVGPKTYDINGETWRNCRRLPDLVNAAADNLWLKRLGFPGLQGRALPLSTFDQTHDAEVLSGCFLMVRREAFDQVGPLDEDFFFYGEDTDWGKRFHDAGWRQVFLPSAEAVHFGGGSSSAYPVKYYLTMEKADLHYWRKHHPGWERLIYTLLRLVHNTASVLGWSAIWLLQKNRRQHARLKVRGNAVNTVWLLTRISLA